ncbi:MAG: hypothetical protein QOF24_1940 [Verrucomicrobiota bacterium]
MTVMKMEVVTVPGVHHFHFASQPPVVISCNDDWLAQHSNRFQQLGRFLRGGLIVDEIAKNNQTGRLVFVD